METLADKLKKVLLTLKFKESESASVNELQNQINSINNIITGNNDTTSEIDTIPEMIQFLSNYNNSDILSGLMEIEDTITDEKFNDVF